MRRPRPRWPASDAASWLIPLGEVAVATDDERVVVADLGAEAGAQVPLRHGHADGVGEALTEGSRRDLDARRVSDLWMAGRG